MAVISPRRRLPVFVALALVFVFLWHRGLPRLHTFVPADSINFRKSSFDWSKVEPKYPPESIRPLPAGVPIQLPPIQYDFPSSHGSDATNELRQIAVRDAFEKSWNAYKNRAWLYDELRPVSGNGKQVFGSYGATIFDALDTLWIMGFYDDFLSAAAAAAAVDWSGTTDSSINLFETTIRYLGGLLAAYDLSQEPALLAKAVELGEMLYAAFDTPNRMPPFWLNFRDAKSGRQMLGIHESSAAGCSFSLEFTRLSQLTGNPKWYDAADRVKDFLYDNQNTTRLPGMWPAFIDYQSMKMGDSSFTFGAQADSLYEYLPKMHVLLGGQDPQYVEMSLGALDTGVKSLLFRPMTPDKTDALFSGSAVVNIQGDVHLNYEVQHLGCFVGSMYGMAGKILEREDYVDIGEKIARGCAWAYKTFPTGIMPEIGNVIPCTREKLEPCEWDDVRWEKEGNKFPHKGFRDVLDPRYMLRPEAIESIFYMYRITGNTEFQDIAWTMFQAIQTATETTLAYSAISSVTAEGTTEKLDSMEASYPIFSHKSGLY